MNYILRRGAGTVYDTPVEAVAAAREAGYHNVRVRYHPDWEGYCVNVIPLYTPDLYLVEQGA